jgi:WD40 repeat protein
MQGLGKADNRDSVGRALLAAGLVAFALSCGKTDAQQVVAQGGAGASVDGAPGAGTTGIVLSEAPPFSIPAAPTATSLVPCDSTSRPEPRGFLADGRAVVIQRLSDQGSELGDLVRAWDTTTDELETLIAIRSNANIRVSDDGTRIFENFSLASKDEPAFRVHVVEDGVVSSSEPMAMALSAVSGDGRFVLDENLRRFTLAGEPDFDFSASLPAASSRLPWDHVAMSTKGDAIATQGYSAEAEQLMTFVVYEDGRLIELAGAPNLDGCCSGDRLACGSECAAFSHDGRYLLNVRRGAELRVWDLSTEGLVVRLDEPSLRSAAFAPGSNRLLIETEVGVTEQNIDGSEQSAWSLDGGYPFVVGQSAVLGVQAGDLVVVSREQTLGRWRQPRPTWEASAVAVTDEAAFAFAADDEFDGGFWMMVARYVPDHAGPTATLRAEESQSEWNGEILLSPDEQRVAVVFPDSIRILDATTLEPIASLPTGAGAIAWSPDGRYLAATPDLHYRDLGRPAYVPTKTLTFWSSTSGKLEASFATPTYAQSVAFSADGTKVVGSGRELQVTTPEPGASGSEPTFTRFSPGGDPISFSLNVLTGETSLNDFGALIGWTRELIATERGVFRISTGEQVSAFEAWQAPELPKRVMFSSNASVGLAAYEHGWTPSKLFGVLDTRELASAPPGGWTMNLALSRDGRRVAAGSSIYCASLP